MAGEISQQDAIRELARRELERRRGSVSRETKQEQPVYSGGILPFTRDATGTHFDSNAGVIGMAKRAVQMPLDVYRGKLQLNDPETGRTSREAIGRANEFAMIASPGGAALKSKTMAGPRAAVAPPSREMLQRAGAEGFEQSRNAGVDYSAPHVARMAQTIKSGLEQDGILAELAPKSFGILSKLAAPPEGGVATIAGLHAARRALQNARLDFTNKTERFAADRIVAQLDEFIKKPAAETVLAGPAAEAGRVFDDALGNYAASKRSEKLAGVEYRADLRSSSANSGQNIGNTIRQRAADVLLQPKLRAGLSKEEIAALEQVVKGTATQNTLRYVGNMLGGGGGLGAIVTGGIAGGATGGAFGGPLGVAAGIGVPALGVAAKKGSNYLTRKAFENVDELTRTRSPLYREMAKNAGSKPLPANKTQALIRLMIAQQLAEQTGPR